MDRWNTFPIVCGGGLDEYTDVLTKGSSLPGVAIKLQNYEPALEGGYQEIKGYSKWDSVVVPGTTNEPVTGVIPAHGVVYATRKTTTDNQIYKSTGSGWGSALNSVARTGTVNKARFIRYRITEEVIVQTDGNNPAWKYNGSTETLINGTGAPADPKYASEFAKRLVLSGYSSNPNAISLSAPNNDTDFDGSNGAIEFTVGDKVLGTKVFRDSLYIFCENSIRRLDGNSIDNFVLRSVTKEIGCLSGDSIQEVGGDVIFLAPDGIRSIAATERIGDVELALVSKNIQPLIRPLLGSLNDYDYSSVVILAKSQYRLFLHRDGLSDSSQTGFLGRLESRSNEGLIYSWGETLGIPAYSSGSQIDGNDEVIVFGHPDNGYVYRLEQGTSFDGSNITSIYQTPHLFFSDPEQRKVIYKLMAFMQTEGTTELQIDTILDFGSSDIPQPGTIEVTLQGGGAALYGSAIYGTDKYGVSVGQSNIDENVLGSGFSVSFKFTAQDGDSTHRIDSMTIEYGIKGRR